MSMRETDRHPYVSDHAVLRYLQRAHGLDVEFFRRHIATLVANGVRYDASAVAVEGVKFVLERGNVVSTLPREAFVMPRRRKSQ